MGPPLDKHHCMCLTLTHCGIKGGGMTVGIGIKCSDGIILACDSLTTFSRGVPVKRYTNKVHLIEHPKLEAPIAIIAAGITTYWDKFRDRACRQVIEAASTKIKRKLDIVEFCEGVCEPVVTALLKEYAIDRTQFLGVPLVEFSFSLIIAGATRNKELRAYFVHPDGVTERLEEYGTIGSGAAYAELFLHCLLIEPEIDTIRAGQLAEYAVSGVEVMDPNVGGETNIMVLALKNGKLTSEVFPKDKRPPNPKEKMEEVLRKISSNIEDLVLKEKKYEKTAKTATPKRKPV
jgi:20S proteasome alpha/beta subunit